MVLSLVALYGLSAPIVSSQLRHWLEPAFKDPIADKNGQAIVVLGGGTDIRAPEYGTDAPLRHSQDGRLPDELLRMAAAYPDAVIAHPYYLRALVTGETDFGRFGYDVCPSVSWDHPDHASRRANGNPTLPLFNAYGADLKTIQFCCTSGRCDG